MAMEMATFGGRISQLSFIMPLFPIEFDGAFFVPTTARYASLRKVYVDFSPNIWWGQENVVPLLLL